MGEGEHVQQGFKQVRHGWSGISPHTATCTGHNHTQLLILDPNTPHHTHHRKREVASVSVKRRVCSISEDSWKRLVSSSTLVSNWRAGGGVSHDCLRVAGKKDKVFSHHLWEGEMLDMCTHMYVTLYIGIPTCVYFNTQVLFNTCLNVCFIYKCLFACV